jgi:hypothetical protein
MKGSSTSEGSNEEQTGDFVTETFTVRSVDRPYLIPVAVRMPKS